MKDRKKERMKERKKERKKERTLNEWFPRQSFGIGTNVWLSDQPFWLKCNLDQGWWLNLSLDQGWWVNLSNANNNFKPRRDWQIFFM